MRIANPSSRCERELAEAKASLNAAIGNIASAIDGFTLIQQTTTTREIEHSQAQITDKIINLQRIAKLHLDNEQFEQALENFECINSLYGKTETSKDTMIEFYQTVAKLCISALKNGEAISQFGEKAVFYAGKSIELQNSKAPAPDSFQKLVAFETLLWKAHCLNHDYPKALKVISNICKNLKQYYGPNSLHYIESLLRKAETHILDSRIEEALAQIYLVFSHFNSSYTSPLK